MAEELVAEGVMDADRELVRFAAAVGGAHGEDGGEKDRGGG